MGRDASKGFTLLEMVIVIVLMAMMAGIAFPNLQRLLTSMTSSFDRDDIVVRFAELGYTALVLGRNITLQGEYPCSSLLELNRSIWPDDDAVNSSLRDEECRFVVNESIVFKKNGICTGGEIKFYQQGRLQFQLHLKPPYCSAVSNGV